MWMRGGTSKGGYFLADDVPRDSAARDALLLKIMGSPDGRQIDGMGGADPLTSKVAIVSRSERQGVDVDYLFLQVSVDKALVSSAQNCGNILAGVGPFAIERGLKEADSETTQVSIFMENTGQIATATVQTAEGRPSYEGDARIDGVPGASAPILLEFRDTQGSSCGALLPTGRPKNLVENVEVTMIDNGMPCVILPAEDVGVSGYEGREELESNFELREKLEKIRLHCGPRMNLGDVKDMTVPKITMVSAPERGGAICTRSFIPHRCHASIGVLAGVTVGTAVLLEGSPAYELAILPMGKSKAVGIEHPTGTMTVVVTVGENGIETAAVLRTANKLMDGLVF
jgi:4-oxalomesaconate tautomerase